MSNFSKRLHTGIFLLLIMGMALLYASPLVISVLLSVIMGYTLVHEWSQFNLWYLTPLYPVLPYVLLIVFNMSAYRSEILWLWCIAIVHDSAAYAIGNLIGKHKLCPGISPGKTWEGLVGGIIASLIISRLLLFYIVAFPSVLLTLNKLSYFGVAIVINIACVAGDLFESWLKRRAHIKDSGSILPGHGGVLDRFDSLFGAIIVWSLVHFFVKYF